MKLHIGPLVGLKLDLWDMPPEDIERITKMILSQKFEGVGELTITNINGNATGCAIGRGASVEIRDLLTRIEMGEVEGPPELVEQLLKRLRASVE